MLLMLYILDFCLSCWLCNQNDTVEVCHGVTISTDEGHVESMELLIDSYVRLHAVQTYKLTVAEQIRGIQNVPTFVLSTMPVPVYTATRVR